MTKANPSTSKKPARRAVPATAQARPAPRPAWEREPDLLFDRLFDDVRHMRWPSFWGREGWWRHRQQPMQTPAVDVYEEKGDVVVRADLPGLRKDDIELSLTDTTLRIKGKREKAEEITEDDYHYWERSFGAFSRTIELPVPIKTEAARATFKDGVLEVRLPKAAGAERKRIDVHVD